MKVLKSLIFIYVFFVSFNSNSQSGYLGSTINVKASVDMFPSFYNMLGFDYARYNKVSDFDTIGKRLVYKKAILRKQFNLEANKVLSDKIQIGIGYSFQKVNITGLTIVSIDTTYDNFGNYYNVQTNAYRLVSDIPLKNNIFSFKFKHFYSGIAPIGKYWGLDVEYSVAKTDKNLTLDLVKTASSNFNNYFKTSYTINSPSYYNSIQNRDIQSVIKAFNLKFVYGRSIPVTRKLALDFSMVIPILKVHFFNNRRTFTKRSYNTDGTYSVDTDYDNFNFNSIISNNLRYNQKFMLNFGVRYFI